MTRLAYGDAASDERPVYTTCDNCGRALCIDCLERVADKLDTFADRAVAHDVLHAMAVRAWRQRELVGRVRGFEPRRGGTKPTPLVGSSTGLSALARVCKSLETCTGTLLLYR